MQSHPLPRFGPPDDWDAILLETSTIGAEKLTNFLPAKRLKVIHGELDEFFCNQPGAGQPHAGSDLFDHFLGDPTLRAQNLINNIPSTRDRLCDANVVAWSAALMQEATRSFC